MHVLLFDIDGTLIDAGGAGQTAMEATVARLFGKTDPIEGGILSAGRTDRAIGRDLFDYHAIPATDENWSRYTATYFSLLPEALATQSGRILPGVMSLIEQLSRRDDVFLGLLTGNFAEGARLKLAHYELLHYFEMGGYGDDHLDRDDVAREAFRVLKDHVPHAQPDDIWVIGDTPSDVKCARAIGANVVAVATGMFDLASLDACRADVLLPDLTHADQWLGRLNPR